MIIIVYCNGTLSRFSKSQNECIWYCKRSQYTRTLDGRFADIHAKFKSDFLLELLKREKDFIPLQ